jgi:excisionase family DNA binding protein
MTLLVLPDQSDSWANTAEAAALLGVHKTTLAKWRRAGEAPDSFMLGRDRLYPLSAINAWCRLQQAQANSGGAE